MKYRYIVITYSFDNYLNIWSNSTTCEKQVFKKYKQLNFHPLNEIKSSIYQGRTSLLPSLVIQITGQYCDTFGMYHQNVGMFK